MGSNTGPGHPYRPGGEAGQDSPGAAVPPDAPGWQQVFEGKKRQLGVMRRWLASVLPECPARDDVISVATELASNAKRSDVKPSAQPTQVRTLDLPPANTTLTCVCGQGPVFSARQRLLGHGVYLGRSGRGCGRFQPGGGRCSPSLCSLLSLCERWAL